MDRLMCLHAQSNGLPLEVWVNGVPVLSLPAGVTSQSVTVHEFLHSGSNRISLVVAPPPVAVALGAPEVPGEPRLAAAPAWAHARLVLLRQGKSLADEAIRVLAEVGWAVKDGESYTAPTACHQDLDLPVSFPRWRWLDAPVQTPTVQDKHRVLAEIQRLAFDLSRGRPDSLLAACRLKLEELDHAYQRPAGHGAAALRQQVQALWEAGVLATLTPPEANGLLLRPVAEGRLLEALSPTGAPVLATRNDEQAMGNIAWPLRLTLIEGNVYVLR